MSSIDVLRHGLQGFRVGVVVISDRANRQDVQTADQKLVAARARETLAAESTSAKQRLDSWKEIASHLRRSVRTVQRWEASEGLPVHRHPHGERDTVYAFQEELDAWWSEFSSSKEAQPSGERHDAFPRWLRVASFAVVGLLLILVALWWESTHALRQESAALVPDHSFAERNWILVTQFDNRTGESDFDGVVDYALERELSNSHLINIVPPQRVADALRLMKNPLDTQRTLDVAREISSRDGEISLLATGRLDKVGSTYFVNVTLVEPAQGETLASFTEETPDRDQVLPAIHRLANRVRESLGESLATIANSEEMLAKVATPSLKALRLYSEAERLILEALAPGGSSENRAAEQLLRQAITEDPEFASAFILLARAVHSQGRPQEDYLGYAERAMELSAHGPERERYYIRGFYHALRQEHDEAVSAFKALLKLHPDHYWGLEGLYGQLWRLGRTPELVSVSIRQAEVRPNDFGSNRFAAFNLAFWESDPDRARIFVQRAEMLITEETIREEYAGLAWLYRFHSAESWLRGDVEQALADLTPNLLVESSQTYGDFRPYLAPGYLALGQLRQATALSGESRQRRHQRLAGIAFLQEDEETMRLHLGKVVQSEAMRFVPSLMTRVGMLDEAEELISKWHSKSEVARGELAAARGDTDEAIRLLTNTLDSPGAGGGAGYFMGTETLSRVLAQAGDLDRAIQVLEKTSQHKVRAAFSENGGAFWTRCEMQLARLFRQVGRVEEAEAIEDELRTLLGVADADHPILLELQGLEGLSETQSTG